MTGNKGGQPTKYKGQETIDKALYYIENHTDEGDLVPSVVGLACYLEVGKSTIYGWTSDGEKPEFSDMLDRILAKQERMLLSGGLSSDMNATIVKLMLSKHDYSDKVEQQVTGANGGPLEVNTFNFIPVGSDD